MSRFAQTDEEAEVRYKKFKSLDPFPEICAALLNSADIEDYVAATGMLFPFAPAPSKKLKLAAYEADFLGEVIYFDSETRELHDIKIERDVEFYPTTKFNHIRFDRTGPSVARIYRPALQSENSPCPQGPPAGHWAAC